MKRISSFFGHWLIGFILLWSALPLAIILCSTIILIFMSVYDGSITPLIDGYTKLIQDFNEAAHTEAFRVYTFITIIMGIPYGWEKSTDIIIIEGK